MLSLPDAMDLDKVAPLAASLMSIDSTSGHEGDLMARVHEMLAGQGWLVERIPVSAGRFDVFARSTDAPFITLSTHLDTVPPFISPRIDAGTLWGRGACDAKGIAAAMMCAAECLRAEGIPIALLFVVGEEVSHDGAHAANEWLRTSGRSSLAIVDGEPTASKLGAGTKGALRVVLRFAGQSAHSAYPELGHSAIGDLIAVLAELPTLTWPADPVLGETTINIGMINGGVADNVVAPQSEARLMARLVTPADDVKQVITRWIRGRATIEWGVTVPPVKLPALPGFETSVVAFATDIPALTNWGTPYLFGPGSVHVAHRADEHVRLQELRAAVGEYVRIVRAAFNQTATDR